ncbi:fimbria/pilus periplasmic chaperone [Salmonella enterica]
MFRPRGAISGNSTKYIIGAILFSLPLRVQAIYVGNLTFSMQSESRMVSKYVLNNNKEARLYRVMVRAIDKPGEKEVSSRPTDGELLFAPRQIALQPGEGDYFKFHYNGPQDKTERYFRISFVEIPPQNRSMNHNANSKVSMIPVITMDTVLVVRPRSINFKWAFDKPSGTIRNSGNTWFKLLIKPRCNATEEESDSWYMRPGDALHQQAVADAAKIFIIYNDRYIKVNDKCGRT